MERIAQTKTAKGGTWTYFLFRITELVSRLISYDLSTFLDRNRRIDGENVNPEWRAAINHCIFYF